MRRRFPIALLRAALAAGCVLGAHEGLAAAHPAYVWLEGEAPSSTGVEMQRGGWGNARFLSGEKWLHCSFDAGKVQREVPEEGVRIVYRFEAPREAPYEVWSRIGFEFARSAFDWRIDDGPWERVAPDALTTDLMEIDVWCEVAWLHMGDRPLGAGPHTLELRLPRIADDKGQLQRIL